MALRAIRSAPKELIVLDGSAHAQFLFQTDQIDRVMVLVYTWHPSVHRAEVRTRPIMQLIAADFNSVHRPDTHASQSQTSRDTSARCQTRRRQSAVRSLGLRLRPLLLH